jgi:hypothetical protein
LDHSVAGHHERASLLASGTGLNDAAPVENLGRSGRGVDELEPSREAWAKLPHPSQEGVPVNFVVRVPLIKGKEDAVTVPLEILLPEASNMR